AGVGRPSKEFPAGVMSRAGGRVKLLRQPPFVGMSIATLILNDGFTDSSRSGRPVSPGERGPDTFASCGNGSVAFSANPKNARDKSRKEAAHEENTDRFGGAGGTGRRRRRRRAL